MRIAVLGAGAMGSWFGGLLAIQGSEVQLLTTNSAHRDAIRQNGLKLRHPDKEQTVDLPAFAPADIKAPVDLVLLFTKAFQSEDAMSIIEHAIDENTHVLSLQNGLGNAQKISRFVNLEKIWIGVSMMPVDKIAAGFVSCKGHGNSFFGNAANHYEPKMAHNILREFRNTGLAIEFVHDVHQRIWEKVAFNAGMNALSALSHGRPGTIASSPGARELAYDVAKEVAIVAKSQQVDFSIENVHNMIQLSCTRHGDHIPSMLQDLLAKKQTEVDALNGAVVEIANSAGIAAPLNQTLATLIRLAELSHQTYD